MTTGTGAAIVRRFDEAVRRHPGLPALELGGATVTYAELGRRVNAVV